MELSEEKIIITGAASGFGEHLAKRFESKARKILLIDIDEVRLKNFRQNSKFECYICDLTDADLTTNIIKKIYEDHPDTRILVNNAGLIHSELLFNFFNKEDRRHSIENWDKFLKINLSSVFYCSVNVVDQMVSRRLKGLIVNISSISANGNAGQSVYSAAKAGVNALTVAWSRELSMFGIRTAGIAPGFFDTTSTHKALKENTIKKIITEIPSRKLGNLDELAKAVEFVISNDYFNGKILEIDGGMVLSHG